jgi:hypothetical protein
MGISKTVEHQVEAKCVFGDVTPTEAAGRELRWFFNEAEEACEQPSNYEGLLLGGVVPTSLEAVEDRAEAIHAAGKIGGWLKRMSVADALMLEGVYRERVWPRAVERALGALAGAVVALPTVKVLHLRALAGARTEAGTAAEWVEEVAKERPEALGAWRVEAERAAGIAVRAYERVRGKGECVVAEEEG